MTYFVNSKNYKSILFTRDTGANYSKNTKTNLHFQIANPHKMELKQNCITNDFDGIDTLKITGDISKIQNQTKNMLSLEIIGDIDSLEQFTPRNRRISKIDISGNIETIHSSCFERLEIYTFSINGTIDNIQKDSFKNSVVNDFYTNVVNNIYSNAFYGFSYTNIFEMRKVKNIAQTTFTNMQNNNTFNLKGIIQIFDYNCISNSNFKTIHMFGENSVIYTKALQNNTLLKQIDLSGSFETIHSTPFQNSNDISMNIANLNTVRMCNYKSFYNLKFDQTTTNPINIDYFGKLSFGRTKNLNVIKIVSDNLLIDANAFFNSEINELQINGNVENIKENAFNGLSEIDISCNECIYNIELNAFKGINPDNINIKANTWLNFNSMLISTNNNSLTEFVKISQDSYDASCNDLYKSNSIRIFNITNLDNFNIIEVYNNSRNDMTDLKLHVNNKCTIGKNSFFNCNDLSSCDFSGNEFIIENRAFERCTKLSTLNISSNHLKIHNNAFNNCLELERFESQSLNLLTIENYAFYNCSKFSKIMINGTIDVIKSNAFDDISSNFYIEANEILTISEYVFANKNIDISVNNIYHTGKDAFSNTTFYSDTNFKFNSNGMLYRFDNNSFFSSNNLKSIKITGNIQYIGKTAFMECHQLEEFIVDGYVRNIYSYAFKLCQNLKIFIISKGLENYKSDIFEDCSQLKCVILNIENLSDRLEKLKTEIIKINYTENAIITNIDAITNFKNLNILRNKTNVNLIDIIDSKYISHQKIFDVQLKYFYDNINSIHLIGPGIGVDNLTFGNNLNLIGADMSTFDGIRQRIIKYVIFDDSTTLPNEFSVFKYRNNTYLIKNYIKTNDFSGIDFGSMITFNNVYDFKVINIDIYNNGNSILDLVFNPNWDVRYFQLQSEENNQVIFDISGSELGTTRITAFEIIIENKQDYTKYNDITIVGIKDGNHSVIFNESNIDYNVSGKFKYFGLKSTGIIFLINFEIYDYVTFTFNNTLTNFEIVQILLYTHSKENNFNSYQSNLNDNNKTLFGYNFFHSTVFKFPKNTDIFPPGYVLKEIPNDSSNDLLIGPYIQYTHDISFNNVNFANTNILNTSMNDSSITNCVPGPLLGKYKENSIHSVYSDNSPCYFIRNTFNKYFLFGKNTNTSNLNLKGTDFTNLDGFNESESNLNRYINEYLNWLKEPNFQLCKFKTIFMKGLDLTSIDSSIIQRTYTGTFEKSSFKNMEISGITFDISNNTSEDQNHIFKDCLLNDLSGEFNIILNADISGIINETFTGVFIDENNNVFHSKLYRYEFVSEENHIFTCKIEGPGIEYLGNYNSNNVFEYQQFPQDIADYFRPQTINFNGSNLSINYNTYNIFYNIQKYKYVIRSNCDLTDVDITSINLSNMNLTNMNFTNTTMNKCVLRNTNLKNSKLINTRLNFAVFDSTNLSYATIENIFVFNAHVNNIILENKLDHFIGRYYKSGRIYSDVYTGEYVDNPDEVRVDDFVKSKYYIKPIINKPMNYVILGPSISLVSNQQVEYSDTNLLEINLTHINNDYIKNSKNVRVFYNNTIFGSYTHTDICSNKITIFNGLDLSNFNLSNFDLNYIHLLEGCTLNNTILYFYESKGNETTFEHIDGVYQDKVYSYYKIKDYHSTTYWIGPGIQMYNMSLKSLEFYEYYNIMNVSFNGANTFNVNDIFDPEENKIKLHEKYHFMKKIYYGSTGNIDNSYNLIVGPGVKIIGENLSNLNFSNIDLSGVNFSSSDLTNCNLFNNDPNFLSGAVLYNTILNNIILNTRYTEFDYISGPLEYYHVNVETLTKTGIYKFIESENGNVKLVLGLTELSKRHQHSHDDQESSISNGQSTSTQGDPHIHPLFGDDYELPSTVNIYRMLQGNNLYVNASTRKLTLNESQDIVTFYENCTGETIHPSLISNGVFYDKLYVYSDTHSLLIDFNTLNNHTVFNNAYFKLIALPVNNNYYVEPLIKQYKILFDHSIYGKIELLILYFMNPQTKHGFKLNMNYDDSLNGLLIREYKCDSMVIKAINSTQYVNGIQGRNPVISQYKVV